ncbi:FAD/NAD(P)-binding domain-containing protein [Calocera viscosa TUFC12733]|uniref:FAD/NAD(P)-binding domain-containing protein n=1 Tax=Calocera viscosa (strain TUFC12733) TaxID=1330018 RepID=A0A167JVN6_CALVF|nr:FAD/NAD(P)-binding domain-containing protein [Calocera viscosa TUFC12733]
MSKSIIIIGAGIAGPVLAMLLKHKGFDAVVYERQPELRQAGIALNVSPQTFKVLNILGLAEKLIALGSQLEEGLTYSQLLGEIIGRNEGPARLRESLGWPLLVVSRSKYCEFLHSSARERGVEMHFSKRCVDVKQEGERVKATFEDGSEAEGDLLVGADGLHSTVRNVLFGKEPATYMGLVQVGGIGPIPEFFQPWKPTLYQSFGDGAHWLSTPINNTEMAWTATMPQPAEEREDWRRMSIEETKAMVKAVPVADWDYGVKDAVASATFVTKFGLYERPIADVWHKGRVVLAGDAAHPTSPHLGQGANQAMEDCYHLVRVLLKATPFTDASLEAAFTEYESIRHPVVIKSVGTAKKQGEARVLIGKEVCEKRDKAMKEAGGFDPERIKLQLELVQGPFQGTSEI